MVLNYIWIAFFVVAFVVALFRLIFLGDTEVFPAMMNSTFDQSKSAFEISIGLTGMLALWLGVMKVGEKAGPQRASSNWLHLYEYSRQYARVGQCRHPIGLESHGATPNFKFQKRHSHQSNDNVSGAEHQRTDAHTRLDTFL